MKKKISKLFTMLLAGMLMISGVNTAFSSKVAANDTVTGETTETKNFSELVSFYADLKPSKNVYSMVIKNEEALHGLVLNFKKGKINTSIAKFELSFNEEGSLLNITPMSGECDRVIMKDLSKNNAIIFNDISLFDTISLEDPYEEGNQKIKAEWNYVFKFLAPNADIQIIDNSKAEISFKNMIGYDITVTSKDTATFHTLGNAYHDNKAIIDRPSVSLDLNEDEYLIRITNPLKEVFLEKTLIRDLTKNNPEVAWVAVTPDEAEKIREGNIEFLKREAAKAEQLQKELDEKLKKELEEKSIEEIEKAKQKAQKELPDLNEALENEQKEADTEKKTEDERLKKEAEEKAAEAAANALLYLTVSEDTTPLGTTPEVTPSEEAIVKEVKEKIVEEKEEEELDIEEEKTAKGEASFKKKKNDSKKSFKTLNGNRGDQHILAKENLSKNQKMNNKVQTLARTGGLEIFFLPVFGMFATLLAGLFLVTKLSKRK